jgi:hypothetical protein
MALASREEQASLFLTHALSLTQLSLSPSLSRLMRCLCSAGALVDKVESHLAKLERNHLQLEDHLRDQIKDLETHLEELLLVCQDLLNENPSVSPSPRNPHGSTSEAATAANTVADKQLAINAERDRVKAQVAEGRVSDLEKELALAAAEADRLRGKVSELERDRRASTPRGESAARTPSSPAISKKLEEELRAQIKILEEQVRFSGDKLRFTQDNLEAS